MGPAMAEVCLICSIPRAEHRDAELSRRVNHTYSADGSLQHAEPPRPEAKGGSRMVIMPAPDVQLRALLVEKGIISVEDLPALGYPGASPS